MSAPPAKPFATLSAADLVRDTPPIQWLAEGLFLRSGVGILGGAPKSCKSFLALELCVAVASATPCAGHFVIPERGHVTLLCAEDPHAVIAARLESLVRGRGVALDTLPMEVIVEPAVRLPDGLDRLAATLERTRPTLLLLDPLIRLHRADENSAAEMSVILDGLRALARASGTAILLVHHARKAVAGASMGTALRGSSDLAAFGDSNLYLRKMSPDATALELKIEHRATACPPAVRIQLTVRGEPAVASFHVQDKAPTDDTTLAPKILAALAASATPMASGALREKLGVRNQLVAQSLHALLAQGRIHRAGRDGWALGAAAT